MQYQKIGNTVPAIEVTLNRGEAMYTQSGGMVWQTEGLAMETNTKGGLMKGLGRMLAGESLFMATYRAQADNVKVAFASTVPGDIIPVNLTGTPGIIAQKKAFLCAQEGVDVSITLTKKFTSGLFGGEGFILQDIKGDGYAFLEVDGDQVIKELAPGEVIKVDTGNVVAFDKTVKYEIEGPLDLLLHLVKESNIDIKDIKIIEITEQYLNYIHKMESLNIDVASEYLVMAATLMEIKSKALLPEEKRKNDEEVDDEEISREALIQKLIDYERYKEITKSFKELEVSRKELYTKAPSKISEITDSKFVNDTDITIDDLMSAFIKYLERKDKEKPITTKVTNKEYSVRKRKNDIKDFLRVKKKAEFTELFSEYNKSYIVVTFMSILELAREDDIIITQENNFDKIVIELKVK